MFGSMRNNSKWYGLLFWLIASSTLLQAQRQPIEISLYYGHPEVVLQAVASDKNQLIYLATNHGFFRFDGRDLIEMSWLPNDISVSKMIVSGDSLLIGQTSGRFTLVSLLRQEILFQDSITDVSIGQIAVCNNGSLLFGTAGNGVYLRSPEGKINSVKTKLSDSYINDLYYDFSLGMATIASDRGLDRVEINEATQTIRIQDPVHPHNDLYRSLMPADSSESELYVLGDATGLVKIKANQSESEVLNPNIRIKHGKLFRALEQLWVLEDESTIYRLKEQSKDSMVLQMIADFTNSPVLDVIGVHEGYLMVWTSDGGLRLVPGNYSLHNFIDQTSLTGITAVCASPDGNIWAAKQDSIIEISNTSGMVHVIKTIALPSSSTFPIISLAEKDNRLMAGSFGDGLFVFDLKSNNLLTHLHEGNGLDNNSILDIAKGDDNIWISTMSGVQSVSGKTQPELHSLSGSPGYVYCLKAKSDGTLFVGSQGESMFVNDGMDLRAAIANDTTIHSNDTTFHSIVSIEFDSANRVWCLTTDSRLFQFENGKFLNHSLNDQLAMLGAYRLFSSPSGNIGLISDHALYDITHEHTAHELLGAPDLFASEYQNISAVDSDGDLWLASVNGLVLIEARALKSQYRPETEIVQLFVNRQLVDFKTQSSFGHNAEVLSFRLRSVWHDPFRPVVSEYRMVGLDTTWRSVVDKELHFAKLSPGKYNLELRTLFGPTMNPVHQTNYSFNIAPPYYFQSWFVVLAVFLFATLLFAAIRWRDRRMAASMSLKSERIQTQFEVLKNQINPHFLFNSFNTLAALIPDDPKKAEYYTEKLSAFFREILTSQDSDTNSLERELQLASDFIFLQQSRYGENLIYEVDVEPSKLHCQIPTLTLQILIENAVKHNQLSKASPLRITIKTEGFVLKVSNNLQLRTSPVESTGLGLNNLSNRLQILTGKDLVIEKSFGIFNVTIPLVKCD